MRTQRQPILDIVDFGGQLVGNAIHGVADMLDDEFEQRGHVRQSPLSALESLAGRCGRTKRLMPSADEQAFGHDEAELADVLAHPFYSLHQIGEYPVDAFSGGVQLLVSVARKQELGRSPWQSRRGRPCRQAVVDEINMQPEPAVMLVINRLV